MSLLNAKFVNHCCKKLYSEKINKRGRGWPIFKKKSIHIASTHSERTWKDLLYIRDNDANEWMIRTWGWRLRIGSCALYWFSTMIEKNFRGQEGRKIFSTRSFHHLAEAWIGPSDSPSCGQYCNFESLYFIYFALEMKRAWLVKALDHLGLSVLSMKLVLTIKIEHYQHRIYH